MAGASSTRWRASNVERGAWSAAAALADAASPLNIALTQLSADVSIDNYTTQRYCTLLATIVTITVSHIFLQITIMGRVVDNAWPRIIAIVVCFCFPHSLYLGRFKIFPLINRVNHE